MAKIPKNLIEKIESIPLKPGIYKMKDAEENIIYIGKSKSLKSRVKSYFYGDSKFNKFDKVNKVKRMIFNIHDIDYIVTDTHLEAQILECALIKKLKPIYNVQFKNHKKYMYLKIENYNRFKPVSVTYEKESEYCFGPYRNKNILLDTIKFFENIYPIEYRGNVYEFTYKILPESIDIETFEKNKECILDIISKEGCMANFLSEVQRKMDAAVSKLQFEMASIYRDVINNIEYLYNNNTNREYDIDNRKVLLGEKIDSGYKLFYISNGRIILKGKYKELVENHIEEFLNKGQKLEARRNYIIDEKRNLDFKKIIHNEIKHDDSKAILFIENGHNVTEFIKNMG